jgi:hypothetical protein
MGPLAVFDLAGLDVGWRIRKEFKHLEKPGVRVPLISDRFCELGRFGQKTGRGYSRYDENRKPLPDPETAALIEEVARRAGIERRAIGKEEIVDRCLFALVNEGAKLLGEGIALRGGHRYCLPERLRLSGVARRSYVLCGHSGAGQRTGACGGIRSAPWVGSLVTRAAAQAACSRG